MAWHVYSEAGVVYHPPVKADRPPPRDATYSGDGVWAEVANSGGTVVRVYMWMNELKDGKLLAHKEPKGITG